jgi:hypothetical protein
MKLRADPEVIVYFDSQFVPLRDARVNILSHALHYGTGVFEGIRAYWDDGEQELFLLRPLGAAVVGQVTSELRRLYRKWLLPVYRAANATA